MKKFIVAVALASVASPAVAVGAPLTDIPCSGYYVAPDSEGGFSVQVEDTVVEIVYVDYSPSDLMRYATEPDGSLTFHLGQAPPSHMRCDATGAVLEIAASQAHLHNPELTIPIPARTVRLIRYTGDIWQYAAAHGWGVGE